MGTRYFHKRRSYRCRDHPHAYGDKLPQLCNSNQLLGSSPRVWGQDCVLRAVTVGAGIIPTRMGTSRCFIQAVILWQDHPHAYGDKFNYNSYRLCNNKSSPRVWGQVTIHLNSFGCRGIIPTRMGTSKSSAQCFPCLWDHPHAYGDKRISLDSFIVRAGSSPRVWGQVSSALNKIERKWIIPTRMGTSREAVMNGRQYEDHPHAYGDKTV